MKEFEIKHVETGEVLETISADSMSVSETSGVVFFYDHGTAYSSKRVTHVTQISPSTLIVEKKTEKPVLVPFPAATKETMHHSV